MGWRSFLKQQLREGKGASKALLIGGGSTELELNKHFRLVRKLGKGNYATVGVGAGSRKGPDLGDVQRCRCRRRCFSSRQTIPAGQPGHASIGRRCTKALAAHT